MSGTIETVRHLSKDLGIKEETLIKESIIEFIKSKIKACMKDRLEIMSRYQISSLAELEEKIKEGSIPEHPGWEDMIILENLENSIDKLRTELSNVRNISTS